MSTVCSYIYMYVYMHVCVHNTPPLPLSICGGHLIHTQYMHMMIRLQSILCMQLHVPKLYKRLVQHL